MGDNLVVMASLTRELESSAECHSVLLEWKQLHDLLQELEVRFSLVGDRVQGRPLNEIQSYIPEIQRGWQVCGDHIITKLIPFAQEIKHIGQPYRVEDGQLSGEEWIVKIVQAQRSIDKDLEEIGLGPLQEHVGHLDSLITKHLFQADTRLQATRTVLKDSVTRLTTIMEEDSRIPAPLAEDLVEFVEAQKRLLEWMGLHGLFQRLRTNYLAIYSIASRKQPTELDSSTIELIRIAWQVFKNTIFQELIAFARTISYIGEAYREEGGSPRGEEWVVRLVQLQEAIDQALKDLSLRPLHEFIISLGSLIRRYFNEADDKLQKTAIELDRLSIQLRGRVGG